MLMERKKRRTSEITPTITISNSLVLARPITEPFKTDHQEAVTVTTWAAVEPAFQLDGR